MCSKENIRAFSIRALLMIAVFVLTTNFMLQAKQKFLLNIDIAQFQDSNRQSYLEIYYSIPEVSIYFNKHNENNYYCDILTNLHIYLGDSLWASKLWKIKETVTDTSNLASQQIVDILRYQIDHSAQYKIKLQARDLNHPQSEDSVSITVNLRKLSEKDLELSDIQIASMIQRTENQGKFVKRNYEVIPNPAGIYGEGSPVLFFYYEAYNLFHNLKEGKYKTLCLIKEYSGNMIENLARPYHTKMKRYDTDVEIGRIDLSNLHSGIYNLIYGICDSTQNVLLSRQKEFYVYNPKIEIVPTTDAALAAIADENLNFLEGMADLQLDMEFEQMLYLTNKNQRNLYSNLTNEIAKKKFIYSIWKTVKKEPTISILEFRTNYLNRIEKTNELFKNSFKDGWKTDRGRVYITYGPPSNIERHPSIAETKPYEKWEYENLEGGVYFIFIDRIGFNAYELIHSTLRGEMYEPNWERLISTDVQGKNY